MGLTQHRGAVATIQEITNLLLLRGNIGKPGAGLCPVRGHSNVQGDRTMGVWEKAHDSLLDGLRDEFGFEPNREHGLDSVDTLRAMRDGRVRVFFAVGGNFVAATPDTARTEEAMRGLDLTVHVSTKLNRSHVVTGREALILPCLGRTERDHAARRASRWSPSRTRWAWCTPRAAGSSRRRPTCSPRSPSSPGWPRRCGPTGCPGIDWAGMRENYASIRDRIERVIPGFDGFNERIEEPGGFPLPHPPRDRREFKTKTGKARFTANDLEVLQVPEGHLLLQTVRSHDQFNTTIYGLDDRYRGIRKGRRVVFVNPMDRQELGFAEGEHVDLVSVADDGERRAEDFRVVSYATARGCAAAYFPETNVLVALDSVARVSNTPVSKSIVVRLEHRTEM